MENEKKIAFSNTTKEAGRKGIRKRSGGKSDFQCGGDKRNRKKKKITKRIT